MGEGLEFRKATFEMNLDEKRNYLIPQLTALISKLKETADDKIKEYPADTWENKPGNEKSDWIIHNKEELMTEIENLLKTAEDKNSDDATVSDAIKKFKYNKFVISNQVYDPLFIPNGY